MKLSDLVRSEGYDFVVDPEPWKRKGILGNPPSPRCFRALVCVDDDGKRCIACVSDCLDWVYSCSHEIAEDRHGFSHDEDLFSMQADILAKWVRLMDER